MPPDKNWRTNFFNSTIITEKVSTDVDMNKVFLKPDEEVTKQDVERNIQMARECSNWDLVDELLEIWKTK